MKYSMILFVLLVGCATYELPNPREAEARRLVHEGTALLEEGQLQAADAKYRMAEGFAGIAEVYEGLGCVALQRGELEKAEHFLHLVLELNPSFSHVYGNLALLEVAKGDLKKAQLYYEKALKEDPSDYKARANYAMFLKQLGLPGAMKMAEEAHALHADQNTENVLYFVSRK